MNELQLVRPTRQHLDYLAPRLRRSDIEELRALDVSLPERQALEYCVGLSALCWVMLRQGEPAAITGVIPDDYGNRAACPNSPCPNGSGEPCPDDSGASFINDAGASFINGAGAPWLVGTDKIADCPARFLRTSRRVVAEYLKLFPRLSNVVDARQTKSLRYLKALGFTLNAPQKLGRGTFHHFYLEAK